MAYGHSERPPGSTDGIARRHRNRVFARALIRHQDRHLGRLRRRQDDVRGRGLGDHAAADRGPGDQRLARPRRARRHARTRTPPRWQWTSAASRWPTTSCSTCSARPGSVGSGSCGTTSSGARSGRSSWSTSVGCRTASRRWTSSRRGGCRSSSPSTSSTVGRSTRAQAVRKALALADHVPIVTVDARDRHSARSALIAVTEYALTNLSSLPG